MIKKLSFKMKLLFSILPVLILGMVFLSTIAFLEFRKTIGEELINSRQDQTKTVADNINMWLEGKLLEVRASSNTPTAKNIENDIQSIDEFNSDRIKNFEKNYPGEYDDAASTLFNNDCKSRAQYANGNFVNGDVSEKQWYQDLMNGANYVISNPVISKGTGKALIVMGAPIKNSSDQSIGTMISAINLEYIQNTIKNFKFGNDGYSILIGNDGTIIVHPDEDLVIKSKITDINSEAMKNLGNEMLENESGLLNFTENNKKYIVFYNKVNLSNWSIASVIPEDELFASSNRLITTLLIITLIIVILIGFIIMLIAKKLTAPLSNLLKISKEIANGNLTTQLEFNSSDEIGEVGRSLNNTSIILKNMITSIKNSANNVDDLSNNLISATEESLKGADMIAESINSIASGAYTLAENASTASVATEDLFNTIDQVNKKYDHIINIVETAKDLNNSGSIEVENTINSMQLISDSNNISVKETQILFDKSKEISQIVYLIRNLSNQINLLALNASIEAARAGEHGKGFSVVANQVKTLAEESKSASNKISDLISGIQTQIQNISKQMENGTKSIEDGVSTIISFKEKFKDIGSIFSEINSIIEDLWKDTNNISNKVIITKDVISNVAAITEENSAITEEVNSSNEEQTEYIHEINTNTKELYKLVDDLQNTVDKFTI